jgi:hypothetical protein
VAAADLNGDGFDDIITGIDNGHEDYYWNGSFPTIRVFSGLNSALISTFNGSPTVPHGSFQHYYDGIKVAGISIPLVPPTADAGIDQTVHVGTVVNLDGSGSSDPDGAYPLAYEWTLTGQPVGSVATLSSNTVVDPTFTPDVLGNYTIQLVVTDSQGLVSSADLVTVSTFNTAPVADAGADDVILLIGTTVQLDGSQSYDDDGDSFDYNWTIQSKPAGSLTTLDDSTIAQPTFIADANGEYVINLVVTDVFGAASDPDSVSISFDNVKPVADAGGNQSVVSGDIVYLNGDRSRDANHDPLTYAWSMVSTPAGSTAVINAPAASQTSFITDEAGTYVIGLVVNDGFVDSDASNMTVTAITVQSAATDSAAETIDVINAIADLSVLKNDKMQNSLTNKINSVLSLIDHGEYEQALDKLQNDLLKKTNGCAETTDPRSADKNDWIKECPTQDVVYPLIQETIDYLEQLL